MSAWATTRDGGAPMADTQTRLCCRGLVGKAPARTPGNEGQASSVFAPAGGEPAETKKARSVVALSRVPRWERGAPVRLRLPVTVARSGEPSAAPLERGAGLFATGKETLGSSSPWRLSGLLSGYLPTDTRPQARAKLGKNANMSFELSAQAFSSVEEKFLDDVMLTLLAGEQKLTKVNGC